MLFWGPHSESDCRCSREASVLEQNPVRGAQVQTRPRKAKDTLCRPVATVGALPFPLQWPRMNRNLNLCCKKTTQNAALSGNDGRDAGSWWILHLFSR